MCNFCHPEETLIESSGKIYSNSLLDRIRERIANRRPAPSPLFPPPSNPAPPNPAPSNQPFVVSVNLPPSNTAPSTPTAVDKAKEPVKKAQDDLLKSLASNVPVKIFLLFHKMFT